ncbi:hypothetical protein [Anatilimnocola floriformis]|uniref:hypothetical protein n=1 Tax=Anatilimnocola floriformis TaxID=2948575 RepID=UPI0020C4A2B5|nr:hypothetical protein [Anatilimnocola floriformis]
MSGMMPNRCSDLSPAQARVFLAALLLIALVGCVLSWNKGKLPARDVAPETQPVKTDTATEVASDPVAPDLQLYRDVTAAVARGENYYVTVKPQLLKHGFPVRSTFNWRLPTYAWFFALLPGPWAIQGLLVLLAAAGLTLHFQAEQTAQGLAAAVFSAFLLIGVVKWSVDGLAFYTQELWAAVLMLVSIGTIARKEPAWRIVAISAGIAALLFRELALPYCFWAAVFATYHRRWKEAAGWSAGIALFFAFLFWHSRQVAAQLTADDLNGAGGGLTQWLKFGGLDFVLLCTRLNAFLFAAPGPVLFLYLLLSLLGLTSSRDERLLLQGFTAASYFAAFSVVGMPINFYWGLLFAPLLPAGVAAVPAVLNSLWQHASGNRAMPNPPE